MLKCYSKKQSELALPLQYTNVSCKEKTYIDGGNFRLFYVENRDVLVAVGAILSGGAFTVSSLSTALESQAGMFAASIARIPGAGILAGGAFVAFVMSNTMKISEAFVTAATQGKGVEFSIGVSWGIIPDLKLTPM